MPMGRCPGQDTRFWGAESISESPCPRCGEAIEFFKDDPRRRCPACGAMVVNPNFDMGCAKWCRFAASCLGAGAVEQGEAALVDSLLAEVKQVFGDDTRRIRHAIAVLDYAERILARQDADPLVVKAAAVLHDIGIRAAEEKHGSAAPACQQAEGPPLARAILGSRGVDDRRIDHISRIVAEHHTARGIDTPEFRIVWDADRLVNLLEEGVPDGHDLPAVLRRFRTDAGRELARAVLSGESPEAPGALPP